MNRNPDDHKIAEAILNVPRQADAFYTSERRRIEREFYRAAGMKPVKPKRSYADRLQERFAQKRAKRG